MTDPLDAMPDRADAARPVMPAPRPRRGVLRRFLTWWTVLALIVAACVACLAIGFSVFDASPVHIVIDGDDVNAGVSLDGSGFAIKALVFACVGAAAMLALLLVPLVAVAVVGAIAFALVAGFGAPLVALAFVLAVATSPVWIVALVVWFLARRRRAHSATIAA